MPKPPPTSGMLTRSFSLGDAKYGVGEQVADGVRAGGRGNQVQTAARGVELAERTTCFQRGGDDTVVDQLAFHDMGGGADRRFDRPDLAAVELERDVIFCLRPDRQGARPNRIGDRDDRLQRLVVNGEVSAASRAISALSATTNAMGSPT